MANPFLKKVTVPTAQTETVSEPTTETITVEQKVVDAQKKTTKKNSTPGRAMTKDDKQFILANFTKMSNSQMAKHLGLRDQQVSSFFAKMKKDIAKVLDDPNASKADKEKMQKLNEFLNQPRNIAANPVGKKKSVNEIVNDYEDLFSSLK